MDWKERLVAVKGKPQWWKVYKEYLSSNDWKKRREKCLKRDGYECRICGSKVNLQAHHKHYRNVGAEEPNDLTSLCESCHKPITAFLRRRKRNRDKFLMFDNTVPVLELVKEL